MSVYAGLHQEPRRPWHRRLRTERTLTLRDAASAALRVTGALSRTVAGYWARARTTVFTYGAFSCFTGAAWHVSLTLGLVVAGVSLLVLEHLSGRSPDPRGE